MNKLKVLFLTLLLVAFSAPINAKTVVLNAEVAMLSTQYAQEAFKTLDEDAGFMADRERLELLQAEGQALVEKFQKDQEVLSDEEKLDMQKQLQDKQADIQFLSNKLQTKAQEVQQQVVGTLTPTFQQVLGELITQKEYDMIVAPGALLYADPDLDITEEVIAYLDNALTEKSE
ncbi:MAG: OmpH family outer membrane protein [SAR86 cluster bacterium]|jgi:outer membrane protein|uniref:OmpH family outer membrane protein n=1 Tax=SAR86 cluster bacterium TaxID=2030880 RepID=A0A520MRR3_9GAMM|nr:MAG: OmpH family outer membrane protein [SAR86 cluster bacterium]|tara:strand:- start:2842 stop:3363 length:522 start_codon:yes stop_codon:yes gene_type:complete